MKAKSYDALFEQVIRTKKIYESVVLIQNGTGETIFSKAYGEKTIDSPIAAAGITKMFTAACIFILVLKEKHISHLYFIIPTKSCFLLEILIK